MPGRCAPFWVRNAPESGALRGYVIQGEGVVVAPEPLTSVLPGVAVGVAVGSGVGVGGGSIFMLLMMCMTIAAFPG